MQENMEEISNIKGRIFELIEVLGISRTLFYSSIGTSKSNFSGKGLKSELNSSFIVRILELYPKLSAEWLLLGKGEMFKDKSNKHNQSINGNFKNVTGTSFQVGTIISTPPHHKKGEQKNETCLDLETLYTLIKTQAEQLKNKEEQLKVKDEQLKVKDEQIDKLLSLLSSK